MIQPYFTGPFAPMCTLFVEQKRALGFKYEQQALLLRMFDNFAQTQNVTTKYITRELALEWSQKRPNEACATQYNRVAEMQRFSQFLCKQGYNSYLLPSLPTKGESLTPYIFTKAELKQLFEYVDHLTPTNNSPNRHLMYPLLFRMLYGCGLRISEALALKRSDLNMENGTLHVHSGKNNVERVLPMSQSLLEHCQTYLNLTHAQTDEATPLFYNKTFAHYSRSNIRKQFNLFLWESGIRQDFGRRHPRVHDLRHSFVCHNILKWAEAGISTYSNLPILSKYLGHTSISATQWYLRLSAEVYPHIRNLCEETALSMYGAFSLSDFEGWCSDE